MKPGFYEFFVYAEVWMVNVDVTLPVIRDYLVDRYLIYIGVKGSIYAPRQ